MLENTIKLSAGGILVFCATAEAGAIAGFKHNGGGESSCAGEELAEGARLDPGTHEICADIAPGESVGSVLLTLSVDGVVSRSQTENIAPYDLFGGSGTDWAEGSYVVIATPYSERNRGGDAGEPVSVLFNVTAEEGNDPPPPPPPVVVSSIVERFKLDDGTELTSGTDPAPGTWEIEAELLEGETAHKVVFELSGDMTRTHTERIAPYDLFGGAGGEFSPGSYTLSATPYSDETTALEPYEVSFDVPEVLDSSHEVRYDAVWEPAEPVVEVYEGETATITMRLTTKNADADDDTADFPEGFIAINSVGCNDSASECRKAGLANSSEDYVALTEQVSVTKVEGTWTWVPGSSHWTKTFDVELETKSPEEQDRTVDERPRGKTKEDAPLESLPIVAARGAGRDLVSVTDKKATVLIRDIPWAKVAWSVIGNQQAGCRRIIGENDTFSQEVRYYIQEDGMSTPEPLIYKLALVREEADLSNTGIVSDSKCSTDGLLLEADQDITITVQDAELDSDSESKLAAILGLLDDEIDEYLEYYVAKVGDDFQNYEHEVALGSTENHVATELPEVTDDELNEIHEMLPIEIASAELSAGDNRYIRGIRTVSESIVAYSIVDDAGDDKTVEVSFAAPTTAVVQDVVTDMLFTVINAPEFPIELTFDVVSAPLLNDGCTNVLDDDTSNIRTRSRPNSSLSLQWVAGDGELDTIPLTSSDRESKIVVHPDDLRHPMKANSVSLASLEQFCLRLSDADAYGGFEWKTAFTPDSQPKPAGTDPIYHQVLTTEKVAVQMEVENHSSGSLGIREPYHHDVDEYAEQAFSAEAFHAGVNSSNELVVLEDYPYSALNDLKMDVDVSYSNASAEDIEIPETLTIPEGSSEAEGALKILADATVEKFESFTFGISKHSDAPDFVVVDDDNAEQEVRITSPERLLASYVDESGAYKESQGDTVGADYSGTPTVEGGTFNAYLELKGIPDGAYYRNRNTNPLSETDSKCHKKLREQNDAYDVTVGFPFDLSLSLLYLDDDTACPNDPNGVCPEDIEYKGLRGKEYRVSEGAGSGDLVPLPVLAKIDSKAERTEKGLFVLERLPGINQLIVLPYQNGEACDFPDAITPPTRFTMSIRDWSLVDGGVPLNLSVRPYQIGRIVGGWNSVPDASHYKVYFGEKACVVEESGGTDEFGDPVVNTYLSWCDSLTVPTRDTETNPHLAEHTRLIEAIAAVKASDDPPQVKERKIEELEAQLAATPSPYLTATSFDTDAPFPFPNGDIEYNTWPGAEYQMQVEAFDEQDARFDPRRVSELVEVKTNALEMDQNIIVTPGLDDVTLEWPWPPSAGRILQRRILQGRQVLARGLGPVRRVEH